MLTDLQEVVASVVEANEKMNAAHKALIERWKNRVLSDTNLMRRLLRELEQTTPRHSLMLELTQQIVVNVEMLNQSTYGEGDTNI